METSHRDYDLSKNHPNQVITTIDLGALQFSDFSVTFFFNDISSRTEYSSDWC